MPFIEYIIALIAPHACLGCGLDGTLLCKDCAHGLSTTVSRCYRCRRVTEEYRTCHSCRSSSKLFRVWSATPYEGLAKTVIYKLKYERARAAAQDIARKMAASLPDGHWIVCHVPTSTTRIRQRGYDQAQLIAKEVAKQTGTPYASLLTRLGQQHQVGQKRAARRQQMNGAFMARHFEHIRGSHILLIDDVITTGATLEAAAAVLKAAGARRVSAAVFAVA